MGREKEYRVIFYTSLCSAIIFALGYAQYILSIELEDATGIIGFLKSSSMIQYISILMVFMGILLCIRLLWIPFCLKKDWGIESRRFSSQFRNFSIFLVLLISILLGIYWYRYALYDEYAIPTDIPTLQLPGTIIGLMMFVVVFATIVLMYKKIDIPIWGLFGIYVICLLLIFLSLYCVSLFNVDSIHGEAVMETVFNVYDCVPFDETTSGIYGHYGLFFFIPMHFLGKSVRAAAAIMALVGCLSYAAIFYATYFILQSNWLKGVAACASVICVTVLRGSNYWQVQPIRILFPALMLAYIVFSRRYSIQIWKTKWMWIGYGLGGLAVVWNLETGIICLVAFSAYLITECLQKSKWYQDGWRVGLTSIGLSAGGVVLAWLIVNLYNLSCGGHFIFRAFFFPMFEEDGLSHGRVDMISGDHPWVYAMLLFFLLLGWGLSKTSLFRKPEDCKDGKAPFAVMIGALGLISIYYYATFAAVLSLEICFPAAICGMALLINITWDNIHCWDKMSDAADIIKKSLGFLNIIVLCVLASQIILSPIRLIEHRNNGYWDDVNVQEVVDEVGETISEDTYGVGAGISEIYSRLGRSDYAHLVNHSDWTRCSSAFYDMVSEEVVQYSSFLFGWGSTTWGGRLGGMVLTQILEKHPQFVLTSTFDIRGKFLYYYEDMGALEEGDIVAIDGNLSLKIEDIDNGVRIPIEIQENTVYKLELTLGVEEFDYSKLTQFSVDFYSEGYGTLACVSAEYFWSEGKYNYVFYVNSGDVSDVEGQVCARVYAGLEEEDLDEMLGQSINIQNITITEME